MTLTRGPDAVPRGIVRVVAHKVDVDPQPTLFQGIAHGMHVALGVVLPGDVRMVERDDLVGATLPRREPI
jgi:hypothetical protein